MFLNRDDINLSAIAIRDAYGNAFSYLYLEKLADEYRNLLGTRKLVMILCDYGIETVAFYYCMLANHNVPILVDSHLDGEMLGQLIDNYRPQYIWKTADEGSKALLRKGSHMLVEGEHGPVSMHEELALLMTTSGSTGSPKLVRLDYNNVLSNARSISRQVLLQQDDIAVTTLPFHYCYGLSVLHMHWHEGASVCVTDWPMTSGKFWDFLEKNAVTNFAMIPYHYDILEKINFIRRDYPALRFLSQAGGKLTEERQRFFGTELADKNIRFHILYGQTEATALLSGVPYDRVLEKLGSVGPAAEGVTAWISNADETGMGELAFKGSAVSMGYAEKLEDLVKGDENHGVLYTGDLAYMDEEGYIYLKGRTKRFVKMLGMRLSLDEMENIIRIHYPEKEIVCTGEDNHILLLYEGEADGQELVRFCEEKFSIKRKMIEVRKTEQIPRNSSGKVMYSELGKEKEQHT